MFVGDWQVPLLAEIGSKEKTAAGDMLLIAEALSRGNSKTEGFKSRVVPVPNNVVRLFRSQNVATLLKKQMVEIKAFDEALRNAIALVAGSGDWDNVGKSQYVVSRPARERFDRTVDTLFFSHLWKRLAAESSDDAQAADTAGHTFRRALFDAAKAELTTALPGIPCAAIQRPKAEARAWRAFHFRVGSLDPQLYQQRPKPRRTPMLETDHHPVETAVKDAARKLNKLAPGPLAELRRMEFPNGAPYF